MMFRRIFRALSLRTLLAASASLALLAFHASAEDAAKRLILKDGSYQIVTKYEVHGDRVRYLSAERDEWEELPYALVDWDATQKYARDHVSGPSSPGAAELEKEFESARETDQATQPEVAPSLRLPEDSGVFLLDNFKGEPQLDELDPVEGDVNRKAQGNIFRDALNPMTSVKTTMELEGEHAAVQSHSAVPSFYLKPEAGDQPLLDTRKPSGDKIKIRLDEPTPDGPHGSQQNDSPDISSNRFRIVRTQVKGGKRTIGDLKRLAEASDSRAQGQKADQTKNAKPEKSGPKPEEQLIQATTTQVAGGWIKITPTESLPPGEYAIVEMRGADSVNLFVWVFGVNPNAIGNKNPWVPETSSDQSKQKSAAKPEAAGAANPDAKPDTTPK